jgi:two-component system LytT family response regulator
VKKIRCVIVDDEPLLREGMRLLLSKQEDIEVVGECGDGADAVEVINVMNPDLVFLDVQMPQMSGFEVLAQLDERQLPMIVFVTAYDQYAVDAFEVRALDYLLKPFTDERFTDALDRARGRLGEAEQARIAGQVAELVHYLATEKAGPLRGQSPYPHRLAVKDRKRVRFVRVSDIIWIESAGNYVHLHTRDQKHLVRQTMKNLEERLDPDQFARVHRTAIVNLAFVQEIHDGDYGDAEIHLKTGGRVPISRTHRSSLKERLPNL